MGPVPHRHLIRLLSSAVALNVVVAGVALYARGDGLTSSWNGGQLTAAGATEPAAEALDSVAAPPGVRSGDSYDTNPADENADVATDVAPDGGWSFTVRNSG